MNDRNRRRWYRRLSKPRFTPPEGLFAPVWSVLYALIAGAGFRLWRAPASAARRRALRWWAAQLALNAAWTPLFFGARRPRAALVDLALLDAAIVACVRAARRVDRPAAWMLAPYLAWSSFALLLNAEIVRRNPQLSG